MECLKFLHLHYGRFKHTATASIYLTMLLLKVFNPFILSLSICVYVCVSRSLALALSPCTFLCLCLVLLSLPVSFIYVSLYVFILSVSVFDVSPSACPPMSPQVKYKEWFDRDLKGQKPHYNPADCLSFKHTQAASTLASQVRTHASTHTRKHTHMHTHAHAYTHTHTFSHA